MEPMRFFKPSFLVCFLVSSFFSNYSVAQANKDWREQLKSIRQKHELMGLVMLMVVNGKPSAISFDGLADSSRAVPLTDSTSFRIASISKTVAATALMKLYEKGLFRLDDEVSKHIGFLVRNPNFPQQPITIRMLLNHTSTIVEGPRYDDFLTQSYRTDPPMPISEFMSPNGKLHSPEIYLNQKPGQWFTYSNLNYALIGTLIEKLSGQRFDLFCEEEILKPLEMRSSSFNVQNLPNINNLSPLYRKENGQWVAQTDNFQGQKPKPRNLAEYKIGQNGIIFAPQGGLRTTPVDLSKFMIMQANEGVLGGKRLLKKKTIREMHKAQWKFDDKNGDVAESVFWQYGLGFHVSSPENPKDAVFDDRLIIGHSGEAYGLISGMYFDKKTKNGFIFMTNGSAKPFEKSQKTNFLVFEEDMYRLADLYFKSR
jgi:CubicO group peptidase (beta-lactamase class C family)